MKYTLTLLLIFSTTAMAGTVELTCTKPTQNTDGTPLTDLAGIRFYESQVSGGPYTLILDTPDCAASLVRTSGTYFYVATAYNEAGVESVYSGEASKAVVDTPDPPTNLVVLAGNLAAYTYSQTADVIRTYQVGTVPEGTACDTTMSVNGLYRVDVSEVSFIGGAQATIAFAECGAG